MSKQSEQFMNEALQSKHGETIEHVGSYFEQVYGNYKTLNDNDKYALATYCESVSENLPYMMEATGTTQGDLGDILKQSMGLVAAQYATSIIPFIGSTQPAEQEIALIYYKKLIATSARGQINAGDTIMNEFGKFNPNVDTFTGAEQTKDFKNVTFTDKTTTLELVANVRPGSVTFSLRSADGNHVHSGYDSGKYNSEGKGYIFGSNIDSDKSFIDYASGQLKITLIENSNFSNNNGAATVVYTDLVNASDVIPSFKYDLRSEAIQVNYFPISTSFDSISDFIAKKKFGNSLKDIAQRDLLVMINNIVSYNALKQLRAAAIKNEAFQVNGKSLDVTKWSIIPPAGVSVIDHRRSFEDTYELAHAKMEQICGVGGVSAVIVGSEGRKIYRALGMHDIERGKAGAYVLGFFNGIPVIYAPTDVMPADEVLFVYKGDDWFTVPLVYAPFMPVMTVEVQGKLQNVFQKQMGIAHGAGIKCVNGGFVQRVVLTSN